MMLAVANTGVTVLIASEITDCMNSWTEKESPLAAFPNGASRGLTSPLRHAGGVILLIRQVAAIDFSPFGSIGVGIGGRCDYLM